ncbi:hypothetical protein JB92DRAFT_3130115 [Gautieria morchelliformis]|nr:hypothetical protein JB92DRAFT_3130115 [Gautieria morchelliformis]
MTGPTKTRDELISSFSSKLFSAMLHEVIMDAALQSHKDILRGKSLCAVCGTRCGSAHVPEGHIIKAGLSSSTSSSMPVPGSPPSTSAAGTSIHANKEKTDGNVYFECTNCQKKIASNRYAPHLSGCLGIGTGSRRGAARNAAAKNKLGADLDRGVSPLVGSDYGSPAHEVLNGKGKGKGRNKKINGLTLCYEEFVSSNNMPQENLLIPKRLKGRPQPNTSENPPTKKIKKQKTSAAGSTTTMLVGDSIPNKSHISTTAKIPVKSGANPTSPYAPGSPSGSGSQDSGRDSPSASASHSVSSSAQSPTASLGSKPPRPYNMSSDSNMRPSRPPSSGRNQIGAVEAAVVKRKTEEKEDPDFIDVDGEEEEEGSSDSS